MKSPLICVLPSRIQARDTGAIISRSSMNTAIRLVCTPAMRRVRSENISEPRPSNWRLTTHPMPTGSAAASARSRSSPVRPRSASVGLRQAPVNGSREPQVRSLNSISAVSPMRSFASSIALFTVRDFTGAMASDTASRAAASVSESTLPDRMRKERSSTRSTFTSRYPAPVRALDRPAWPAISTGSMKTRSVVDPLAPGSWMMIRSSPNIWIIGSSVPNRLTRAVIFFSTPSIWSGVGFPISTTWKTLTCPSASSMASRNPVRRGSSGAISGVRIWKMLATGTVMNSGSGGASSPSPSTSPPSGSSPSAGCDSSTTGSGGTSRCSRLTSRGNTW